MTIIDNMKRTDNFIIYLYFYFFVMPWNFEKWQMGVLSVIMFIWWIIKYKKEIMSKLKTIFEFKPLVILILFILYSYIAVFWSEDFSAGLKETNKFYKYYFFIIPVLFTSLTVHQAKNILKILIFSFSLYALFSLLIYLGLFTISETNSNTYNPKGLMGYAIVTQYMAIGALGALIFALFEKKEFKFKIIFFIMSFLCFLSLFVNNSRTAQLAFLLASATILIVFYNKQFFKIKNLFVFIFTSFLLLGLSFYLLNSSGKIDRFNLAYVEAKKVFVENKFQGSFGVRIYFYKAGLEIFKDNIFFGTGVIDNTKLLAYIQKNDPLYKGDNGAKRIITSFHSEHMNTLTKYGIVGYLLLVSSIVYLLYLLRFDEKYFFIGCSFYIVIFYISLANATFLKKPINYILVSVFVLLSIIAYDEYKKRLTNDNT